MGTAWYRSPRARFFLCRISAWGPHAPFDPRFFMFFEDVDLCLRIYRHGLGIWFTDRTHAMHLRERSTALDGLAALVWLIESRWMYFEKWHGLGAARLVSMFDVLGCLTRAVGWGDQGLLLGATYRGSCSGEGKSRWCQNCLEPRGSEPSSNGGSE